MHHTTPHRTHTTPHHTHHTTPHHTTHTTPHHTTTDAYTPPQHPHHHSPLHTTPPHHNPTSSPATVVERVPVLGVKLAGKCSTTRQHSLSKRTSVIPSKCHSEHVSRPDDGQGILI